MSSTYGDNLKLSIFGQSHSPAIGMVLDGIPAGLPVDTEKLQRFLNRRAPGRWDWSTPRKEADVPEFLGGLMEGYTCGAPIAAVIANTNTRSGDYADLKDRPRPGHADYTAQVKYGGFQDAAGGGHFSGRLTAPLCIAGGMCMQWLEEMGINIQAHIEKIGSVSDTPVDPLRPMREYTDACFPVADPTAAAAMKNTILDAKQNGDSIGGMICCCVTGLPAGIGEPMFGGVESKIAQIIYGIPAAKALSFGVGIDCAGLHGSECNDPYTVENGDIHVLSNHAGGILGGISNGAPVIFRTWFKPTPSISRAQQSISLSGMEDTVLEVKGRHDPCIVPRAVPVVEAAAAIAIYDLILGNTQTKKRK